MWSARERDLGGPSCKACSQLSRWVVDPRKAVKARGQWVANPLPQGGSKTLEREQLCSDQSMLGRNAYALVQQKVSYALRCNGERAEKPQALEGRAAQAEVFLGWRSSRANSSGTRLNRQHWVPVVSSWGKGKEPQISTNGNRDEVESEKSKVLYLTCRKYEL